MKAEDGTSVSSKKLITRILLNLLKTRIEPEIYRMCVLIMPTGTKYLKGANNLLQKATKKVIQTVF